MSKQHTADPDQMNDERAERAAVALQSYLEIDGTDPDDFMTDVLTDLMHYCNSNGIDFGNHLRLAHMHYEEETESTANWHPEIDEDFDAETQHPDDFEDWSMEGNQP